MRFLTFSILLALPAPCLAQSAPTVTVIGRGEVALVPDFATLSVGVRVQQPTPEAAAAAMSESIDAVVDTLVSLGFPRDSLPTRVFGITADRAYQEGNRITGYTSQVTLDLRTSELDRLAEFVGAAIAAGATDIGQVQWGSTEAEAGRREALRLAVINAQADAEVIADARSSNLGELVDISVEGANPDQVMFRRRTADIEILPPPVTPSALIPQVIKVTMAVVGTWRLGS